MPGLGVANNINNTNNINFSSMPMCVGMYMDFLSPKTYRLAQPHKVFYFAVPHNCEKPESFRGGHNLNPNRECLGWGFNMLKVIKCCLCWGWHNINNTNNIKFPPIPMCGRMHMYFPYIRNPQACTDWKGF